MRKPKCSLARALVAEKAFGMMIVIDSRLTVVEMRRRNPLGVTISEFYCPPAFVKHSVIGFTHQCQPVDIGPAAAGPIVVVMNFGPICGDGAAGGTAAAILGVEDQSLVR